MNRETLVEKAAEAIYAGECLPDCDNNGPFRYDAVDYPCKHCLGRAAVDALLPQVTTVEELEALPPGSILLTPRGELVQSLRRFVGHPLYWFEFIEGAWRGGELQSDGLIFAARGPLTIVWKP